MLHSSRHLLNEKLNATQVWENFRNGESEAFELIYQTHVLDLFDYGMHIQADADLVKDAIQELFIHIWQRRRQLGNVKNIQNYLMVSLRHKIIEVLRQRKKGLNFLSAKSISLERSVDSYEYELISQEDFHAQDHALTEAIEKLPARQKEVIYLLFYKNVSQEEAADIMSLHLTSVYTLSWKAVKSLKKYLRKVTILFFSLCGFLY